MVNLGIPGVTDAELIGRGSYSKVFKARWGPSGTAVAVKILTSISDGESARRRLAVESQAMTSVSEHPDAVTVHETGMTADQQPYLIMEFVDGDSLQHRLTSAGPLPIEAAVRLGLSIAGALEAAHSAGVVHGDISPANILLAADGFAKLTDFGMARLSAGSMTRTGTVSTAVAFAPPEVLTGDRVDKRGDVYALGAALFAALRGSPAFFNEEDESLIPLIGRIASMPVPDLTEVGVPTPVATVIETAMAKSPTDRYADGGGFRQALEAGVEEAGLLTAPSAETEEATGAPGAPVLVDPATAAGSSPTDPADEVGPAPLLGWAKRPITVAAGILLVALLGTASFALTRGGDGDQNLPPTTETPEQSTIVAAETSTTLDESRRVVLSARASFEVLADNQMSVERHELGPRGGREAPVSVEVTEDPSHGRMSVSGDGTIVYVPEPGFSGIDEATVRICYEDGTCFDVVVEIAVSPSPKAPDAQPDEATTVAGDSVDIRVLDNDGDGPEPDPGSLRIVDRPDPSHGSAVVTDREMGIITFTAGREFTGTTTFSYEVRSEQGGTALATVTVEVEEATPTSSSTTTSTTTRRPTTTTTTRPTTTTTTAPPTTTTTTTTITTTTTTTTTQAETNRPPTARDLTFSVTPGSATCLNLLQGASDPDGDSLSVSRWTTPGRGSLSRGGCPTGQLRYEAEDASYITGFTFWLTDGTEESQGKTVSVTVSE